MVQAHQAIVSRKRWGISLLGRCHGQGLLTNRQIQGRTFRWIGQQKRARITRTDEIPDHICPYIGHFLQNSEQTLDGVKVIRPGPLSKDPFIRIKVNNLVE